MLARRQQFSDGTVLYAAPVNLYLQLTGDDSGIKGVEIFLCEGHAGKGIGMAVSILGKLRRYFLFSGCLDDPVHGRAADLEAPADLTGVAAIEAAQHLPDKLPPLGLRPTRDVGGFSAKFLPGSQLEFARARRQLGKFRDDVVEDQVDQVGC